MTFRFGEFEFDEERFELRRQGKVIALPALAMDTLKVLIQNRGKLVSIEQLIAGPWRGQVVSHSAIRQVVVTLRRALDDDPASPSIVRTVRGKGFRFEPEETPEQPPNAEPLARAVDRTRSASDGPIFVGRQRELDTLSAAGLAPAGALGSVVLIAGAPGIGKTALVDRLSRKLESRNVEVLRGRCWEGGGAPALWPWPELVRTWIGAHGSPAFTERAGERLADLGRLLPELNRDGRSWSEVLLNETEHVRFRVFDSLKVFLQRSSQSRPLLLVLEDIHRADDDSLELLDYLARGLAESRVLIVATCRPLEAERRSVLESALRGAYPFTRVISLSGLEAAELAEWLAATSLGRNEPALLERSGRLLHEFTGGHPLLVQEAVRRLPSLAKLNDLRHALFGGIELPARVTAAIRERIEPLPSATREVLRDAALLGREFRVSDLPLKALASKQQALEWLAPALPAGVLEAPALGQLRFRFAHDLVREALLVDLPIDERSARHAAIATHLSTRVDGDDDELLFQVAHHALAGQSCLSTAWVLDTLHGASECARHRGAYELSEVFCNDGLELSREEQAEPARHASLMLSRANTRALRGRLADARADYASSAQYAWSRGLDEALGQAVLSWFHWLGEEAAVDQVFQTWIERAMERVTAPGELRARLLCVVTISRFGVMPAAECRALLIQARDMVQDDPQALVAMVGQLDRHHQHVGDADAMLAVADAAIAHVRSGRVAGSVHKLRIVRMGCLIELGRGAELMIEIAAHAAESAQSNFPEHVVEHRADWLEPLHKILLGEFEASEAAARRIYAARGHSLAGSGFFTGQSLAIALDSPEPQRTRMLAASLESAQKVLAVVANYAPVLSSVALLRAELGELAESRAVLDSFANAGLEAIPDDRLRPTCFGVLARAACLCAHEELIPLLYKALMPYAGRHLGVHVESYLGPVSLYLGELCRATGDTESALSWFKRAVGEAERACSRPASARARRAVDELQAFTE